MILFNDLYRLPNLSLGQKVKYFRLKSGLSQLELELEIDASPGSICRLEADKVNPTKETLFSISKALNLTYAETAYLFGIIEKENLDFLKVKLSFH